MQHKAANRDNGADGHLTIFKFTGNYTAVVGTPTFEEYTMRDLAERLPDFRTLEDALDWAAANPRALDLVEAGGCIHKEPRPPHWAIKRCQHEDRDLDLSALDRQTHRQRT